MERFIKILKNSSVKLSVAGFVVSALGLVAQPVLAANPGWYVGAGVGRAETDLSESGFIREIDDRATNIRTSSDDSDSAYKLTVGYDFTKNFAIESSYIDFGEASLEATGTVFGDQDSARSNIDADGLSIAAVGKWHIGNDFSLLGKVGAFYWDGDADFITRTNGVRTPSEGSSDDGVELFYGVGAQYDFGKFAVRGEYEIYNDIFDEDVDVYTINLLYSF